MNLCRQTLVKTCLCALIFAGSPARADVVIIDVPAASIARGIPLQAGDILREGDAPTTLDVFRLLALETVNATRGTVRLQRIRAGVTEDVDLPAGDWSLIAIPLDAAGNPPRELDIALSHALANGDSERAGAFQLARARLSAGRHQFAAAAQDFVAATALLPAREHWIAQTQAIAFERHPDRTQGLLAAERALELRRTSHAQSPLLAASMQLVAVWRVQTRDNEGARKAAAAAIRLAPGTLVAANAHVVLAFIAMRTSQLDVAASELDRAEVIVVQLAPEGLEAATLLARRALLSALRREGDGAARAFTLALIPLRQLAPGSMLLGRIAFNAQLHALERLRYAEAEGFARESMAAFAAAAPNSLEYAQARAALAEVLMRRTQYAQAETLLRAAWQASNALNARSYEALSLKLQLGDSLARQQRLAEALLLYDQIEQVLAAADAPEALSQSSLAADTALYRGNLLSRLDRCPEAVLSGTRALDQYRVQQRSGTEVWDAHLLLSECKRRQADLSGALDHAHQAIDGFRVIAAGGIQEACAQFALARAQRDAGNVAAAVNAYRAAIDGLESHREHVGGSAEIQASWAAQFQDFYKELLWLLASDSNLKAGAGYADAVLEFEARYRVQALRQLLGEEHSDLAATWATRVPKLTPRQSLTTQLPHDTALLSFVVGRQGTLAIVVLPGRPEASIFRLPATRAKLDVDVDRMLLLGARSSDDPLAVEALQRIGSDLHDALIAPLHSVVDAYPRWIVVADGPLLQLPWSALVVQRAPQLRYLVEDRVLSIVPSAPVWSLLAMQGRAPDSILAFADPSVGPGEVDTLRNVSPRGLPGARHEVDALAALYPGRVTAYSGTAATEAQLRAAAPTAGSIHFALHSVTDAREPMASHIVLASGDGQQSEDDGRLHADEIARQLRLNADLIVLSSCASARGVDVGGEGLLGLIRALHLAGARAVIGTTWPVSDQSTARLMTDFYRHRKSGEDSAGALTAAQRDWLASARDSTWRNAIKRYLGVGDALPAAAAHPFYWAGFVHSGAAAR
ncbi:MAG: CHAT domain-containing protein [Pseudomonadota bacterium]|nr:CHAT domain-containing protein [Pseudomonadota bacterium]